VAVELGAMARARFSFDYVVRREADDALIVTGRTTHACVDATSLRPVRPPAWLLDDLRLLAPA
jgi:acyl-CoA thioesterase FadM